TWGKSCSGSRRFPCDRNFLRLRRWCRSCRESGTCETVECSRDWRTCSGSRCAGEMPARQPAGNRRYFAASVAVSRFLDDRQCALFSSISLQDFFAEAEGLGSDLYEFVVCDEFDGLLQIQRFERNQADGFIGGGGSHVGELLFADGIYVQ